MVIVAILDLLVLYEVVMIWCRGWWWCPGTKDGGSGKSRLQKIFLVEAYFPPISLPLSTQFHSDQHLVFYGRTKTIVEKLEESEG